MAFMRANLKMQQQYVAADVGRKVQAPLIRDLCGFQDDVAASWAVLVQMWNNSVSKDGSLTKRGVSFNVVFWWYGRRGPSFLREVCAVCVCFGFPLY